MQTLVDRLAKRARTASDVIKAAAVSEGEALGALRTLESRKKPSRYLSSSALGALAVPVVKTLGAGVEIMADPQRRPQHIRELAGVIRKEMPSHKLVRSAFEGAVGGGVVKGVGEGIDAHAAKKTLRNFMQQDKSAGLVAPAAVTATAGTAASKAKTVGMFKGMQSATGGSLKPPGSPTAGVVKPTAPIGMSISKPR